MILILPIQSVKKNSIFFILCVKKAFSNITVFQTLFWWWWLQRYRQYFSKLFSYSKRAVHTLSELQVSYGSLGNFFFSIGPEVKKPWGSQGVMTISLFKGSLTLLYYKSYDTSQKSNPWLISFIFFVSSLSSSSN